MKKVITFLAQGAIKLLSKLIDKLNGQKILQQQISSEVMAHSKYVPEGFVRPPAKFSDVFCRADEKIVETNKGITIHIPRVSLPPTKKEISDAM
jgi:hypothetical protein